MRRYRILYVKEIKRLSIPFLLILMIYGWFILSLHFTDFTSVQYAMGGALNYYVMSKFVRIWSLLLIPGMFAYSLYEEYVMKTTFQMFSLPAPRYIKILYKYLAVLSMGIVVTAVITLYNYLFELKLQQLPNIEHSVTNPVHVALFGFSLILYLLGTVCTGAGILFSIKRYHIAVGIFLFILFFPFTGLSSWVVYDFKILKSLYLVIRGLPLLIIGLYLFEKYADL